MTGGRHLAKALEVGGFARQNVLPGNGPERFRGKSQIHRVTRLVWKIDREPRKDSIDGFDAPKTPASVHAEPAIRQLHQCLDMLALELASRRHFLKFFFHNMPY